MKLKLLLVAVLCTAIFSSHAAEEVVLIHGPEVDLTLQDVKRALASMTPEARRSILMDQRRIRNVMDSTYMAKVAAERARKHGLEKDPVVQAKIWNRTLNILASAELDRAVEEQLGSNADYESMARERYLLDKEKFREPEKVTASHILLKTEGKDEKAVLERIREIRQEILSGKISFEEAAKKYSEGPSAPRGGSLGTFTKGRMVKPFEDAAFSLKEGEISEPVKTQFGYHLILVQKKEPGRQKSFDEVKDRLIEEARQKARSNITTDYWLKIRDDPRVKLNEKAIDAFLQQPDWDLGKESAAP